MTKTKIPWQDIPRSMIARTLLSRIQTAKDLELYIEGGALAGNCLTVEDFKYHEGAEFDELLPAQFRVVVDSIQNGIKPPPIGPFHTELYKLPLKELAERVRAESQQGRLDSVLDVALKHMEKDALHADDIIDELLTNLGELKAGINGSAPDKWLIYTATELRALELPTEPWLWKGYLAPGQVTLLSGHAKEGKSTMLFKLLPHFKDGTPFFQRLVAKTRVLYLSEEPVSTIQEKLEDDDDGLFFINQAFSMPWETLLGRVEQEIKTRELGLVIIDSLTRHWDIENENQAGETSTALRPIFRLAQTYNVAVLLVHHSNKMGGTSVQSARGSSAITADVDNVMLFSKEPGHETNRRIINSIGRAKDATSSLMVDWHRDGDGQYVAVGVPSLLEKDASRDTILKALSGRKLTPKEIMQETGLKKTTVYTILAEEEGKAIKADRKDGVKKYWVEKYVSIEEALAEDTAKV